MSTNQTSSSNWLGNGNVVSTDASTIANIFTTIFLVLNFSIAFIGHRLIKRQGHRTILKSKPVPITRFTPWLSLGSTFTYIWTLRRIPGGYLGFIMIASGLFGTGNRYIINSCIVPDLAPGVCRFDIGIVTLNSKSETRPASTWSSSYLALQAFDVARANKAKIGIYSKVNRNLDRFYPTKNDVVGNWNCSEAAPAIVFQPEQWAKDAVEDFVDQQSFVDRSRALRGSFSDSSNSYSAFMIWAPHKDPATNRTSVRATIANRADTEDGVVSGSIAASLECNQIIIDPDWTPAPWTPTATVNGTTRQGSLNDWAELMFGLVLGESREEYPFKLTKVLNAMSMLSGSGNRDNRNATAAASKNAGTTYGCLIPSTRIYNTVYVVTLILFILLFIMIVVDVYDLIRTKLDKRHKEVEKMPFDMLEWQVALVEKMTGDTIPSQRKLAGYEYFWDESTGRSHCRKINKNRGSVYEAVENPGNSSSDPSIVKHDAAITGREQ